MAAEQLHNIKNKSLNNYRKLLVALKNWLGMNMTNKHNLFKQWGYNN